MPKEKPKYAYIDFARGIAILLVVLVHSSLIGQNKSKLLQLGQFGVQLFFIISALTLCISFQKLNLSKKDLIFFYKKRLFRIAPLYWIGIFLFFTLNLLLFNANIPNNFHQYNLNSIIWNLTLIHGISPHYFNSVVPGGWSIGTELIFYLIFPFVFTIMKNVSYRNLLILILSYIVVIVLIFLGIRLFVFPKFQIINLGFIYCSILVQFPVFLIGILLYKVIQTNIKINIFFLITTSLGSFCILLFLYNYPNWLTFTLLPSVTAYTFFCYLFYTRKKNFDLFNLIKKIGQRSYSIYLIHTIFCWITYPILRTHFNFQNTSYILEVSINFSLTTLFSYIIATFSYKFIELPFIHLANKSIIN